MLCLWKQLLLVSLVSAIHKLDNRYGYSQQLETENQEPAVSANKAFLWPFEKYQYDVKQDGGVLEDASVIVQELPETVESVVLQAESDTGVEQSFPHLGFVNFKWPKYDLGKDYARVSEDLPQQHDVLVSELASEAEGQANLGYSNFEWPKFDFGKDFVHVTEEVPQMEEESVSEAEGHAHLGYSNFKWPKFDFGKDFVHAAEEVQLEPHVLESELVSETEQEHAHLGHAGLKWPKFDFGKAFVSVPEDVPQQVEYEEFKWPKLDFSKHFKTVFITEEEVPEVEVPKLELPKIQKEVKEVPVYVYRLPPWPEMKKFELPKQEQVKDIPLVMYEFPPLPEYKPEPLPEYKMPQFRIEKYILPPLPKMKPFKIPKVEPIKEIPLIMYEFPKSDIKPIAFPKLEPIKEIPIVVYELPAMPKMKPLPKIKMPEIKIIKKKLPEIKPINMPKFDLKLPEIKVVKYQMPAEAKPFKFPELKVPEVRYVKYEMPLPEKKLPEKLPEFKLPEFKLPEFKLPEVKPLELPEFKLPEYHHMPPMHFMPQMMAVPVAYTYPVPAVAPPKKHLFGDFKSKFYKHGAGYGYQPVVHGGHEHVISGAHNVHDHEHIASSGHHLTEDGADVIIGTGHNLAVGSLSGHATGGGKHFAAGGYHNLFGKKFLSGKGGQTYLVLDDDDVDDHEDLTLSQVYVSEGDNGFTLQSDNHWLKPVEFFDTAGYDNKEGFLDLESAIAHGSIDEEQLAAGFNKSSEIEEASVRNL